MTRRLATLLAAIAASAAGPLFAACESSRVSLQVLGSGGPELAGERASSGYLIRLDGRARVIVDAGPGTVQRFKQSGAAFEDVDLMLFTHFHVDHSADFAAYVKGSYFTGRDRPLRVIGPSGNALLPGAGEFVKRMLGAKQGVYPYLSEYQDAAESSDYKIATTTVPWQEGAARERTVYQSETVVVRAVAVHHGPLPALGYRVELAGCAIAFTGDMSGRFGGMPALAKDADILVAHNAVPEDAGGAAAGLHMKPGYIGELAAGGGVKQLVLSHLMRRTEDRKDETLRFIRTKYAGPVKFASDLDVFAP